MIITDKVECKIPEWAVNAIINDDWSGIENQDDINALQDFLGQPEFILPGYWVLVINKETGEPESYFSWTNDVNDLGGIVYDMEFLVYE
jgi:hypothetical protein